MLITQPEHDSLIGAHVGSYVVDRMIGRGGMGAVYLATHATLRRRVALKVLLPEFTARADITARFVQEAMASAHVVGPNGKTHRNVVESIDTGTLPDGRHWIMVEFLEGRDLERYTDDLGGRLAEDEVLGIVAQTCAALHAAHTAKDPHTGRPAPIVHRDLKPANLFMTRDDTGRSLVKLLDFGIAKVAGAMKATNIVTGGGVIMGSPAYMAPEQARTPLAVDARADLYALGVMIYQLLTGRLPHQADNAMAAILAKQEQTPPTIQSIMPGIAPIWDRVVTRCLEWDPAKRYGSARAIVADLMDGAKADPARGLVALPGVEGGAEIVMAAWPAYLQEAGAADETTRADSAISRWATPTPAPPLARGTAAGAAGGGPTHATSRRNVGLVVGGVVLLAAGIAVGVLMSGGASRPADSKQAAPAEPQPAATLPPAAPAPAPPGTPEPTASAPAAASAAPALAAPTAAQTPPPAAPAEPRPSKPTRPRGGQRGSGDRSGGLDRF